MPGALATVPPNRAQRRSKRAPARYEPKLGKLAVAAELLDCNERTVRRMVAAGVLRGYRVGRVLRVDLNQVRDELLQPVPPESVSS